jgi:ABC-type antimicrobial peptide transport system permease subunit
MARWRYQLTIVGTFAAIAVFLTCAGLYGVISAVVGRQRRSIGIRMALGGTRLRVGRELLSHGVVLIAVGVAVGVLVAAGASRFIRAFLYDVSPIDPLGYATAASVVLVMATLACLVPVRRAAMTPPLTVLREE